MDVSLKSQIRAEIEADVSDRFDRYVRIHTTSDADSVSKPSTVRQMVLLEMLRNELSDLKLVDIELDPNGFVYATLPSNLVKKVDPFGLMAHVDSSPDQSGENVKPIFHKNWDGSEITFPDDGNLRLGINESPELRNFIGQTIITASGLTLLAADDKAGVAELMAAFKIFQKYSHLPHGEIRLCFTTDEEVGRGIEMIKFEKLPRFLYTMDGGFPGELEIECFDACKIDLKFKGNGVHPGYGHGKMVNAIWAASHFVSAVPWEERPERSKDREGFYHLVSQSGNSEEAQVTLIVRDFDNARNQARLAILRQLKAQVAEQFPGLAIEMSETHQYENMHNEISRHPHIVKIAEQAIRDAGVEVIRRPIRGGTDGARLTAAGHPTPNIFAGGMLFHSRREWVALSSMVKAVETIIHLARRWSEQS